MKLKIKFLNKLFGSKISKVLRNLLNIKSTHLMLNHFEKNISVSDGFFWRVDNNFKTIFKFTDLLNLFFNQPSSEINLVFFDKKFNFIKEYTFDKIKNHNSIIIDQKFLNLNDGYGSFYIFHSTKKDINAIIRNSCYTGYSYKNSIPSFVHGNLHSASKKFNNDKIIYGLGAKLFFKKNIYKVQNFMNFDKTELILLNNCNSQIKVNLGFKEFFLNKGCVALEDAKENKLINIRSNSSLLRPIIFNYKGEFVDVYHG